MTVEGKGLCRFLALALRPYLHLQLSLAYRRHDVDIVLGSVQFRHIQRGVFRASDACHPDVEGVLALCLVQAQHDVLVVTCFVYLVVEPHCVLGCRVVEQVDEGIHFLMVVLNAMIYLLPLELTDVSP